MPLKRHRFAVFAFLFCPVIPSFAAQTFSVSSPTGFESQALNLAGAFFTHPVGSAKIRDAFRRLTPKIKVEWIPALQPAGFPSGIGLPGLRFLFAHDGQGGNGPQTESPKTSATDDRLPYIVESAELIVQADETDTLPDPNLLIHFTQQVTADPLIRPILHRITMSGASPREQITTLARNVLKIYAAPHLDSWTAASLLHDDVLAAHDLFARHLRDAGDRRIAFYLYLLRNMSISNVASSKPEISEQDLQALFSHFKKQGLLSDDEIEMLRRIRWRIRGNMVRTGRLYDQHAMEVGFPGLAGADQERILSALHRADQQRMIQRPSNSLWQQMGELAIGYYDARSLSVNKKAVENRFAYAKTVSAYATIHQHIVRAGYDGGTLLYPFGGADVLSALYLTNASVLRFYDALPFGWHATVENAEPLERAYRQEKANKGYTSHSMLDAIGFAKFPILWELRALGASEIQIREGESPTQFIVDFKWSYDGISEPTPRRLEYNERSLDDHGKRDILKSENTYLLNKANFKESLVEGPWPPIVISFMALAEGDAALISKAIQTQGYVQYHFVDLLDGKAESLMRQSTYAQLTHGFLLIKPRGAEERADAYWIQDKKGRGFDEALLKNTPADWVDPRRQPLDSDEETAAAPLLEAGPQSWVALSEMIRELLPVSFDFLPQALLDIGDPQMLVLEFVNELSQLRPDYILDFFWKNPMAYIAGLGQNPSPDIQQFVRNVKTLKIFMYAIATRWRQAPEGQSSRHPLDAAA